MSDIKTKLEILGRLRLWSYVLDECHSVLKIAKRAETEMNSEEAYAKHDRYSKALQEFAQTQPDYIAGTLKHSHALAFEQIQQKEFPAFTDCFLIKNYCHMLAVVLFCQIFNPGYSDEGKVAGNNKTFISLHFESILHSLFKTPKDKSDFDALLEKCLWARDKMIGHADGKAFEVIHGTPISKMKHLHSAIEGIDFIYMEKIVKPLSNAVLEYANKVRT